MQALTSGNCYRKALDFFLISFMQGRRDLAIVHGFLTFPSGKKINHAWVESNERKEVYEITGWNTKTKKLEAQVHSLDTYYVLVTGIQGQYSDLHLILKLMRETNSPGPNKWIEKMRALGKA